MLKFTTITDEELKELGLMVSDTQTGNHLLRPRSELYKKLANEFNEVMKTRPDRWTERQRDLYWCFRSSFYPDINDKFWCYD